MTPVPFLVPYALSDPITVVPEPGAPVLNGTALFLIARLGFAQRSQVAGLRNELERICSGC
jgi:hypothetical protein